MKRKPTRFKETFALENELTMNCFPFVSAVDFSWKRKCGKFGIAVLVFLCMTLGGEFKAFAHKSAYDWAFIRLDYAKNEKVRHLKRFCDRIHALARQAAGDASVLGCFDVNLQYERMVKKGPVPDSLKIRIGDMRNEFNRYYIENYFSFYDILFVDSSGRVFFSIRKEKDLHTDLITKSGTESPLGRCLAHKPQQEKFVDFHHYGPTAKPAAFFVEPVRKENVVVGWLLLQCAINKVNTIFSGTEDLGRTGETFLVNHKGLMLTESNFIGDSTILKKRLDDRNIQAKFEEGFGNRAVTDYRGCRALTSFAVVDFLGTRWLVVAKVDRGEVVTEHYARHRRYYADKLIARLKKLPEPPDMNVDAPKPATTLRIDMDEFIRAHNGERLQTFGVSTCTGLVAAYPDRFAYMAHISPIDKVYGADGTNLVGQVITKIKSFDIYPCEKRAIDFVVVAPHLDSLLPIIDKLVAEGFLLSQINILFNPRADSARINYDYATDLLHVRWRQAGSTTDIRTRLAQDATNAGNIVRQIVESEDASGNETNK